MAKKSCGYESQVANGAKAGITGFIIGAAIALGKRVAGARRRKKGGK